MAEDLYKKRMIGLKVIRKKVKELDKRISGMDDPIKKSKLSKQRDKAIGRIDSRLKMKNFGFGTKAGVTRKRNEFLKTGKMPKTISGSVVKFTKKLGGIEKQAGGMVKAPKKKLATGGFKDAFGMGVGRIKKSAGNLKKAIKPRQKFVGRKAQTMRKKMAK
jgi:hypothetical protein